MEKNTSSISFDSACRKLNTVKSFGASPKLKQRKKRKLKDLSKRVESNPTFYACISPRSIIKQKLVFNEGVGSEPEDESISNSMFNPCLFHTDSEVNRCNNRLLGPSNSNLGKKVWNSITRLGVSYGGNDGM